ncbi:MAG: ATP-binding cassette domain-containing protein [Bacteroidota bacterium]|jgi:ATPase subunit of ABC transporter with duplicated ATPase domains|nr:ATP-binding cassette domain-containing protein [Bacteroidota bacterium]
MSIFLDHITFTHDNAALPVLEDVTVHFDAGWTGIVGANGSGKTTLLHLAAGLLDAQQGQLRRPSLVVLCPQRTDDAPEELPAFLAATDAEACTLRGRLQVGEDWADRWATLSHGERKRAQIGLALWREPEALLLDEPTNHIDSDARALLIQALRSFRGVGLVVSHDRELLDLLCTQCLFLAPPRAVLRPGGYTQAAADGEREAAGRRGQRQLLQQELQRLKNESQRRHAKAAQADRLRSKRGLARGDSDGRAKLDLARVSGKDGQAGRMARQLDGRIDQLEAELAAIPGERQRSLQFWLEGSSSPRRVLFSLPGESIPLDGTRTLHIPDLTMTRDERVALTGANGLGKSTFIRHILRQLDMEPKRLVYLPQEIDLEETRRIMAAVRALPRDERGKAFTVVSALGSDPKRLLGNDDASPGELRKVLLALGVIRRPYLIVMDEPTNHLDLPAIERMEQALADCPCGLLLVSHDLRFLSRIATVRWDLTASGADVQLRPHGSF